MSNNLGAGFHVGHNIVGEQPGDEPSCFNDWQLAAGHLIGLMREYADEDDDAAFDSANPDTTGYASYDEWLSSDEAPSMRATVDSVLTDDPPVDPNDYTATVEQSDHRRVAFWLAAVACDHTPDEQNPE